MSSDREQRQAERARQGSRRRRDRAALQAAGEQPKQRGFQYIVDAGRELFPEADSDWWPIVGSAVLRFKRTDREVTREAIVEYLAEIHPEAPGELASAAAAATAREEAVS